MIHPVNRCTAGIDRGGRGLDTGLWSVIPKDSTIHSTGCTFHMKLDLLITQVRDSVK